MSMEIGAAAEEQAKASQEVAQQVELGAQKAAANASASVQLSSTTEGNAPTSDQLSATADGLTQLVSGFRTYTVGFRVVEAPVLGTSSREVAGDLTAADGSRSARRKCGPAPVTRMSTSSRNGSRAPAGRPGGRSSSWRCGPASGRRPGAPRLSIRALRVRAHHAPVARQGQLGLAGLEPARRCCLSAVGQVVLEPQGGGARAGASR